LSGIILRNRSF